jgi:DHA1 family inner membrane transport protein
MLALALFAAGHVAAALSSSFWFLLGARFVTAFAVGAFWAVGVAVATGAAGPQARATSVVNIGYAGGSWLAGLALSTSLGLRGPALTGLILALASLVPLTLLAAVRPSASRLRISRRLE